MLRFQRPSYVAQLPVAIGAMLVCALVATAISPAPPSSSSAHLLARVYKYEPLDPAARQAGSPARLPPAAQQQNSPNPVPKGALSSDPQDAASGAAKQKAGAARPGASTEIHGWALTWSDEFNTANGSRPDPAKWKFDVGGHGWGNRELEYYTDRPQNAFIEDGHLVIRAIREDYTGADGVTRHYTSARLKTQEIFAQAYGRFEARIKIPNGQGMWPAFWLLGNNLGKVPWPGSGEIDIMENIGREPSLIHGSMHGPGYSGNEGLTQAISLPGEQAFYEEYHLYAIEWEPGSVSYFVDSTKYATFAPAHLAPELHWVFDHPFFILLNVAVGGDWPGAPDESTVFPQSMLVDFVRVYRKTGPEVREK
jgi:beta-glucanase (GH16 family)